jgi:hypothetical protein
MRIYKPARSGAFAVREGWPKTLRDTGFWDVRFAGIFVSSGSWPERIVFGHAGES